MSKTYLLRGPQSTLEALPYPVLHEQIGTNLGNLVYIGGVVRTVMTESDTSFQLPPEKYACTPEDLDRINQTCSACLIPLADALRGPYAVRMQNMTKMIRALRIPCVIMGCGLRAPYEPDTSFEYPFNDTVYDFFSAVLEKSAIIGLRGEITAAYLKKLGFREEKDYTVIGCPSVYMFGGTLSCRTPKPSLFPDSAISFNVSPTVSDDAFAFVRHVADTYPASVYLPQNSTDELLLYYGEPRPRKDMRADWPCTLDHPFLRDHTALMFNHPMSWINFQRGQVLSVGTRVHGNITAVLAGIPALFLPQEARTRELCEYHQFAYLTPDDMKNVRTLPEALERVDFMRPVRRHSQTFRHYLDFMRANALPTIYDAQQETVPYDQATEEFHNLPALIPIDRVPAAEAKRRREEWESRPEQIEKRKKNPKPTLATRVKWRKDRIRKKSGRS